MSSSAASSGSAESSTKTTRLTWFDACRVFGALGVILIHSTTDFRGQPFTDASVAQRIFPVVVRAIGEFSSSELFLLFSLFLLAWRLDKKEPQYRETVASQAERLLIPFVFWVVFYAFFRLLKANAFGYDEAILAQLSQPLSWLGYFVLGSAQYHLHFVPTLAAIVLFYPLMRSAVSYPALGLLIVPSLYVLDAVQDFTWSHFADPVFRDYVMRGIKIFCYVGYGFAAFALYGFWKRGVDRVQSRYFFGAAVFVSLLFGLAVSNYIVAVVEAGRWVNRPVVSFFGHALLPISVFALFMSLQFKSWNPIFSKLAKFTFGVYLLHPIGIDLYDIVLKSSGLNLSPWVMVLSKWIIAVPIAFGLAFALSKSSHTAWLIGLGDFPLKGWRSVSGAMKGE